MSRDYLPDRLSSARRILWIPDDYRKDVDLGWASAQGVVLDTGKHPSGPGQAWFLDDREEATRPNGRSER